MPWSASWTNYFYSKCLKCFKGHIDEFVEEPFSLKLCLTWFSIVVILTHYFIHTCLFHVQYQVSASVMMYRLFCKYLFLLLNYYYFRSSFSRSFLDHNSQIITAFNAKMLLRVQTSNSFLYRVCISPFMFVQNIRAVCANQTISTSWPSCKSKTDIVLIIFYSLMLAVKDTLNPSFKLALKVPLVQEVRS